MEQRGGETGRLLEEKTKSLLNLPSTANAKIWHNGRESNSFAQHPSCSSEDTLDDALSIPKESVLLVLFCRGAFKMRVIYIPI